MTKTKKQHLTQAVHRSRDACRALLRLHADLGMAEVPPELATKARAVYDMASAMRTVIEEYEALL